MSRRHNPVKPAKKYPKQQIYKKHSFLLRRIFILVTSLVLIAIVFYNQQIVMEATSRFMIVLTATGSLGAVVFGSFYLLRKALNEGQKESDIQPTIKQSDKKTNLKALRKEAQRQYMAFRTPLTGPRLAVPEASRPSPVFKKVSELAKVFDYAANESSETDRAFGSAYDIDKSAKLNQLNLSSSQSVIVKEAIEKIITSAYSVPPKSKEVNITNEIVKEEKSNPVVNIMNNTDKPAINPVISAVDVNNTISPLEINEGFENDQIAVGLCRLIADSPKVSRAKRVSVPSVSVGNGDVATVSPPPPPPGPIFSGGAPPPPPPPNPLFRNIRSNSIKPATPPKFKNCPITPVKSNPDSLFAEIDLINVEEFGKILDEKFTNDFGINPPKVEEKSRRDSGYDENEDQNNIATSNGTDTKKSRKPFSVLDSRRSYTLDIVLKQIRIAPEKLVEAVFSLDTATVTVKFASTLQRYLPTDSDIVTLRPFVDQVDYLPAPDRYMVMVSTVPEYGLRLKCIEFMHEYAELAMETSQAIENLHVACGELMADNGKFKDFLRYCYGLAFYMNQGRTGWHQGAFTNRSKGFRISDIVRLTDVRSNNNGASKCSGGGRYSLFEYLVRMVAVKDATVLSFHEGWKRLRQCRDVKDLSFRAAQQTLKGGIAALQSLYDQTDRTDPEVAPLAGLISGHLSKAKYYHHLIVKSTENLRQEFMQVLLRFNDAEAEDIAGDKLVRTPEDFFGDVIALIDEVKKVKI